MDAKNSLLNHIIVGAGTLGLVAVFHYVLGLEWPLAFARTSFVLIFLILLIGPLQKIKAPLKNAISFEVPLSWRGELGLWFTATALTHFVLLWLERPLGQMIRIGGSGYGLANFIGLVALLWTLVLAATSFNKIIIFLGLGAWKWLHGFTHVVFYLSIAHIVYFQFFSTHGGESGPDWFGYMAAVMASITVLLQLTAFAFSVSAHRKKIHKETSL